MSGFPPMRIYVGENELLLSDSLKLGENAYSMGVDIEVHVFKKLFHAFPILSDVLPEAKTAMREIVSFLKRQLEPQWNEITDSMAAAAVFEK